MQARGQGREGESCQRGGAFMALLLGLISMALGGLALARSRRAG
ncbi:MULTISPECIES: DUF6223 family protein [unclassified Streptomyces]|nr:MULTISPECIES: DUF6223 family protein [unclassified Streptomyces]